MGMNFDWANWRKIYWQLKLSQGKYCSHYLERSCCITNSSFNKLVRDFPWGMFIEHRVHQGNFGCTSSCFCFCGTVLKKKVKSIISESFLHIWVKKYNHFSTSNYHMCTFFFIKKAPKQRYKMGILMYQNFKFCWNMKQVPANINCPHFNFFFTCLQTVFERSLEKF